MSRSVWRRADTPRAGVRHRLVVEIDRVLRREQQSDAEGPGLLEQRQDRLLGRRIGRRGDEAEHLVHVDQGAQVAGPGLATAST